VPDPSGFIASALAVIGVLSSSMSRKMNSLVERSAMVDDLIKYVPDEYTWDKTVSVVTRFAVYDPAGRPINFENEFEIEIENGLLDRNRNRPWVDTQFRLDDVDDSLELTSLTKEAAV